MKYSNIPLAQTVVELCKAKHIEHIIISPGSRNAPLTISFTNDRYFRCYSIVDERSAAFFALGIAQQTGSPAALICTSGSAVLNYYPAVAEAFYSDIPLVIISADRPEYLIDIGDGQTIRQPGVFGKHIVYEAHLKTDVSDTKESVLGDKKHELPWFLKGDRLKSLQEEIQQSNESEINKALNACISKMGPVHLNVPFEEPLYEMCNDLLVSPRLTHPDEFAETVDIKLMEKLTSLWNQADRKMILVGVNPPGSIENRTLELLAQDASVLVFTETTSNLSHPEFFPSIDKIIAPIELSEHREDLFKKLQPDILITFGGMIVSKKVKAFLRKYQPKHHWHIDEKKAFDTFFCLEHHIRQTPQKFFNSFLENTKTNTSPYKKYWKAVKQQRVRQHNLYLKKALFSDIKVFDKLLTTIPDKYLLQLGNSSAVRYVQLFDINPTLRVFCNRGTSGIDGSTSTAIGASLMSETPTLLISGDLSFLYDSNALWNKYIKSNFRIIVINNGGGGIFRILPGDKTNKNFGDFFETIHPYNALHLCNMYNFEYVQVRDYQALELTLKEFYKSGDRPKLMEIFTPRELNDKQLLDYFKYLK